MIAATPRPNQPRPPSSWQQALADAITNPAELLELLGLDRDLLPGMQAAARDFPLRVPRGFAARMRRGDPSDPLLLQVLPGAVELVPAPGFGVDPVGELDSRQGHGLLHKYSGRSLLIATGACAIHCRYCFRRHFPYPDETASSHSWQGAIDQLKSDASVQEVILSGGDPLSLSDRRLSQLTTALAEIPHVRRLRIHTRQPIVLPERVDGGLLGWLDSIPLQKVIVLHANHAREIDGTVVKACRDLAGTGTMLLNQSVLLAGVNDTAEALADLSEALIAAGVLPYYLHVLDRVSGASHFDVPESVACDLVGQLVARLPGFLVPKLVRELPGKPSKTPVTKSP